MGFRTQLEVWPELGGGPFLTIRDKKVGMGTDIEKYVGRCLGSWGSLYPVVFIFSGPRNRPAAQRVTLGESWGALCAVSLQSSVWDQCLSSS